MTPGTETVGRAGYLSSQVSSTPGTNTMPTSVTTIARSAPTPSTHQSDAVKVAVVPTWAVNISFSSTPTVRDVSPQTGFVPLPSGVANPPTTPPAAPNRMLKLQPF